MRDLLCVGGGVLLDVRLGTNFVLVVLALGARLTLPVPDVVRTAVRLPLMLTDDVPVALDDPVADSEDVADTDPDDVGVMLLVPVLVMLPERVGL